MHEPDFDLVCLGASFYGHSDKSRNLFFRDSEYNINRKAWIRII